MGKKKTITEKVKTFYRGPWKAPNRIADENELRVISDALIECVPKKNCTFEVHWNSETTLIELAIGFNSSLRCLRQKRTRAMIVDGTTPAYILKYLIEFAAKIPVIQANRLIDIAPQIRLKTLMVVSLVKPNAIKETTFSEKLQELCHLLTLNKKIETNIRSFHQPIIDKLPVSGSSKAKKEAKKEARQAKLKEQNKSTC